MATYEAHELRHYAYQGLRLGQDGRPPPPGPNVYFVTITVGALVVQVTGSVLPDWPYGTLPDPVLDELGVVEIWPASRCVEFEQLKVMAHETMLGFSKLLYNVVARLTGGAPPAR